MNEEQKIIKGVKGFNKEMQCRDFQYAEGKEYDTPRAKACCEGFHFCENPIDVLKYYAPGGSLYHMVEGSGQVDRDRSDSKVACTHIKIGARISLVDICKMTFDYVKSKCTNEYNAEPGQPATAGDSGAATAGNYGAATAGDSGAATAGYKGAATAGNYGAATAGNYGAATAGDSGAATAGDSGAATAGNYGAATAGDSGAATAGYKGAATAGNYGAATAGDSGAATAGYKGAATAGNYGAATSRGKSAVGENGLAVARGNGCMVKGGLGALLVIAKEKPDDYDIVEWKAVIVDGEKIKADTWYRIENGELKEA